jgi:hypothetical protein
MMTHRTEEEEEEAVATEKNGLSTTGLRFEGSFTGGGRPGDR